MVSDDTEHAVMTLLSLMDHDGNSQKFSAALACRLRWWLASVPAGIGLATARSLVKFWLGFKPAKGGYPLPTGNEERPKRILGYYTLSSFTVRTTGLPEDEMRRIAAADK